jgi:hypothetical protein
MKHPNDMTAEELRELYWAMAWAALDLAQHLHYTTKWLKDEYKEESYKKAVGMAYDLVYFDRQQEIPKRKQCNIAVFGETGLETINCDFDELLEDK